MQIRDFGTCLLWQYVTLAFIEGYLADGANRRPQFGHSQADLRMQHEKLAAAAACGLLNIVIDCKT